MMYGSTSEENTQRLVYCCNIFIDSIVTICWVCGFLQCSSGREIWYGD